MTMIIILINLGAFCFHTAKTAFLLPIAEAKRGLKMLKEEDLKKINFSVGRCEMEKYCKEDLDIGSVKIVSNGSKIWRVLKESGPGVPPVMSCSS